MKMTQKLLAEALKEWFLSKKGNINTFNDNPVGILIQKELEKMGHWKSAPRGNPRKGYERMKEALYKHGDL